MEIISVYDERFRPYGRVVQEFDCGELLRVMESTPVPEGTVYVASDPELEKLSVFRELEQRFFGDMPIQMGYCNGHNQKLNALEYHKSSEWNLACTDLILLVGKRQDVDGRTFTYDTKNVEAFLVPAGTAVETYSTTLHYAPCGVDGKGFRFVVVLPKGTNLPLDAEPCREGEAKLITNRNKWLIAHPESGLNPQTVHMGLLGENLTV